MYVGWVKLHRVILEKAIWKCSTPEQKVVLMTVLMLANHSQNQWIWKGQKYFCQPGQFITSLKSLASVAMVSEQNVRTALSKFEKLEFLTNESTSGGRLITICNWDIYQNNDTETNKQSNKGLTNDKQTTNKGLTTNKNIKKDNNDKECKKCLMKNSGVKIEDIRKAFQESPDLKNADAYFYFNTALDWSSSKGEMRTDWIATVRNFARSDKKDGKMKVQLSNEQVKKSSNFEQIINDDARIKKPANIGEILNKYKT